MGLRAMACGPSLVLDIGEEVRGKFVADDDSCPCCVEPFLRVLLKHRIFCENGKSRKHGTIHIKDSSNSPAYSRKNQLHHLFWTTPINLSPLLHLSIQLHPSIQLHASTKLQIPLRPLHRPLKTSLLLTHSKRQFHGFVVDHFRSRRSGCAYGVSSCASHPCPWNDSCDLC